jgi:hypothetical protein
MAELVSVPIDSVGAQREMRASEAEFDDSIQSLREKYAFNHPEAVESFLKTHRRVAPLLIDAAPQFAAAFGHRAPLALEIMPDDEPPRSKTLMIDGSPAICRRSMDGSSSTTSWSECPSTGTSTPP